MHPVWAYDWTRKSSDSHRFSG